MKGSYRIKVLILLLIIIHVSTGVTAQVSDTVKVKKHSPTRASIMSACLPGLGQLYNRRYWKIPVLYAGIGAITFFARQNWNYLQKYSEAYKLRTDGDPATIDSYYNKCSADDLLQFKNYYRRNFEVTVIFAVALYALNIVDASVDAHLFRFDINDNLSMKISPLFIASRNFSATGLSFSFTFGK